MLAKESVRNLLRPQERGRQRVPLPCRAVRCFLWKPFEVEELARSVADALASTDASRSVTAAVGRQILGRAQATRS